MNSTQGEGPLVVRLEPIGKNHLAQQSFGGDDPIGLSLIIPLASGLASILWRAVYGRGRWRVSICDRQSGAVLHTATIYGKRRARRHGDQVAASLAGDS